MPQGLPDPTLLVPITVEALVIVNSDINGDWAMQPMNYSLIGLDGSPPLQNPDPGPIIFSANSPSLPASQVGIHLHWTLPDALTHGLQQDDGSIVFPYIPNRWLVIRSSGGVISRTWIIQSDYVGSDGTTSFPTENPPGEICIGRAQSWDSSWQEPGGKCWLTAMSSSDINFTSFYPNCRNVLGFQDDFSGDTSQGPFNYMVVGWYSDPSGDPLSSISQTQNPTRWDQFVNQANWAVNEDDEPVGLSTLCKPFQTVCHGMIYDVPWLGAGGQSQIPISPIEIEITVGNTAAEAIGAYVENALNKVDPEHKIERLMEALQYNLLMVYDNPNARTELRREIHENRFAAQPGGTTWTVTRTPDPNGTSQDDNTPVNLTPEQQTLLSTLNITQMRLDALQRNIAGLQKYLYLLWWKYKVYNSYMIPPDNITINNFSDLFSNLVSGLDTLNSALAQLDVNAQRQYLQDTLDDSKYQIVAQAAPSFWIPTDFSVLVTGTGRSYNRGEDGRFDPNNLLACRLANQPISAVTIPANNPPNPSQSITVSTSDLGLQLPTFSILNAEISALFTETYFLDQNNAAPIAQAANSKLTQKGLPTVDPTYIQAQQTLIWNCIVTPSLDCAVLQDISGLNAVAPLAFAVQKWQEPWSPLFLDWQASFQSSYGDLAADVNLNGLKAAMANWTYSADTGDYVAASSYASTSKMYTYSGRVLLTPQVTLGLQTSLQNLGSDDKDNDKITNDLTDVLPKGATSQGLIDAIDNWDVLSQAMSGLLEGMIQQQSISLPLPPSTSSSLSQSPSPASDSTVASYLANPPGADLFAPITALALTEMPFLPLRAGIMTLTGLTVVDSFGRALNPYHASPIFYRAGSLIPPSTVDNTFNMQIPPRISQPSRMLFELFSAESSGQSLTVYPQDNPVCGWIIANNLDQTLMFFDQTGTALGSLVTVYDTTPSVRWDAAPGSSITDPSLIDNPYLRQVVLSLRQPNLDGGDVLTNIWSTIDLADWSIDPANQQSSEALSVLIGRPLALVRAGIQIQLATDPAYDLSWKATTGNGQTYNWTTYPFPCSIGYAEDSADGVIGFFADDDITGGLYPHFHAVTTEASPTSQYIVDNTLAVSVQAADAHGLLLPGSMMTILVDPRGCMSVLSGILPVQQIRLPGQYVISAEQAMQVTFRTGPILGDLSALRLPPPPPAIGTWSWIQCLTQGVTPFHDIDNATDQAIFTAQPGDLLEGWLKLIPGAGAFSDTDASEKD